MAHFLGLGGASKFLSTMQADPQASGAALFPAAARANRSVFYQPNGAPRSLEGIYQRLAGNLGAGSDSVTETRAANLSFAAQTLNLGEANVITGANESASDALAWANSTLGRFGAARVRAAGANAAGLLRPTPDTARLAYLMLSRMGG